MKIFNLDNPGLTSVVNQAREIYIESLFSEKVISREVRDDLLQYAIVVSEPGMLGRFWNKFFKKSPVESYFTVVKVMPPKSDITTEEYE